MAEVKNTVQVSIKMNVKGLWILTFLTYALKIASAYYRHRNRLLGLNPIFLNVIIKQK